MTSHRGRQLEAENISVTYSGEATGAARIIVVDQGRQGKMDFVRVLRLLETFPDDEVHAAVRDAVSRGATGYDAVKHLLLCRIEGRPPRLDLELHPYLPSVSVSTTSAQDYMKLLREKAS